jgi:hypothetical protein
MTRVYFPGAQTIDDALGRQTNLVHGVREVDGEDEIRGCSTTGYLLTLEQRRIARPTWGRMTGSIYLAFAVEDNLQAVELPGAIGPTVSSNSGRAVP